MSLFSTISNKAADLTQRLIGALPSYSNKLAGIAATLLAFSAGTANAQQPAATSTNSSNNNNNNNNTNQTAAKKDDIATHSNLTPREIYNSLDRYLKQNTNLSTGKRFEVIEGFFKINTGSDIYLHMSKARLDQPMVVLKSEQKLRPEQVGYTQDSIKKFYGVDFAALNTTIATAQTAKKEAVAAAAEKAKIFTNQDFINVADAYFKKTTVGLSENQRMARIDRALKAINGENANVEQIDGKDSSKEFVLAADSVRAKKLGADATAILALVQAKIAAAKKAATTGDFIDPSGPTPTTPRTTTTPISSPAGTTKPAAAPIQKPNPAATTNRTPTPATTIAATTATAQTYDKLLAEARAKKPASDADLFSSMRKAAADTQKQELLSIILNRSKTLEAGKALPTLSQLSNRQVITAVFRFGESLGYKAQSPELGALADKILRQEFKKDLASMCLNRDALFGTKTTATAKTTTARTSQAARPATQSSKAETRKKATAVTTAKPYEFEVRARKFSDPVTLSTTRVLEEIHPGGKVVPIAAETVFQKRIPIISNLTGLGINYRKVSQTQHGFRDSRFFVPVHREGVLGEGIQRLKRAFVFGSEDY